MPDYGLTVAGLADAIGVSRQSVNELLRARRAISPEMVVRLSRLSRLFGNSPDFWLNAQRALDLWDASRALEKEVRRIKPLGAAYRRDCPHSPRSRLGLPDASRCLPIVRSRGWHAQKPGMFATHKQRLVGQADIL